MDELVRREEFASLQKCSNSDNHEKIVNHASSGNSDNDIDHSEEGNHSELRE